ncbi:MAG: glycosyltransferase family protein [Planctomycetota bacterium]|jgi:predicted glycosyltransferase
MTRRILESRFESDRSTPRLTEIEITSNGRPGPRIALYSHDTQGLGHIRRNLLIAKALCRNGTAPTILLLSGIREASAFGLPAGVDCLTLPSLGKGVDGRYYPRSLGVPMSDLIKVRSRTINAVLQSFDPDVLIVDKVPRGIFDELLPSLGTLEARGRARIVLGLREVLDDPDAVRREWAKGDYSTAIRTFYHRVWVYGDPTVYDPAREYGFPSDIAAKVCYTGYLNPREVEEGGKPSQPEDDRGNPQDRDSPPGPHALCLVGGGRDGLPLAEAFLRARLPGEAVLVTGPLMPDDGRAILRRLAVDRPHVRILEFITDPCPLLLQADRVVAMGGYNTICEIVAHRKPALIVPRIVPRTEQLIRASRFADLGLVDLLHPDNLSPEALSRWLARPHGAPTPNYGIIDFDGVRRLPDLLDEALAVDRPVKERSHGLR